MEFKKEKMAEVLHELASEYIQRESNKASMITITNIGLNKDFKKVTFFVTVFPESKEQAALDFLKRSRSELRDFIKERSKLSHIPTVDIIIDGGEKARQKIFDISQDIK